MADERERERGKSVARRMREREVEIGANNGILDSQTRSWKTAGSAEAIEQNRPKNSKSKKEASDRLAWPEKHEKKVVKVETGGASICPDNTCICDDCTSIEETRTRLVNSEERGKRI